MVLNSNKSTPVALGTFLAPLDLTMSPSSLPFFKNETLSILRDDVFSNITFGARA